MVGFSSIIDEFAAALVPFDERKHVGFGRGPRQWVQVDPLRVDAAEAGDEVADAGERRGLPAGRFRCGRHALRWGGDGVLTTPKNLPKIPTRPLARRRGTRAVARPTAF